MERENLFSSDMSRDELVVIDRGEFIIRRDSATVESEKKRLKSQIYRAILLKGISGRRSVLPIICRFSFLLAFYSAARAIIDYFETKEPIENSRFIVVAFLLIVSGVTFLIERGKISKKESNLKKLNDEYDILCEDAERAMDIPRDAATAEIFCNCYDYTDLHPEAYVNNDVKVFGEGGRLCFYYKGCVIAVAKESIEAVVKVNQTAKFTDWLKGTPYGKGEYEQYGIEKTDGVELDKVYSVNCYYSIRFSARGVAYEIIIPPYDISPVLDILKIEVTEE